MPGAIAGVVVGLLVGAVVEWVLGVVFKFLLVALTILLLVVRIQACAAFREGVREGMAEQRGTQPISAVVDPGRLEIPEVSIVEDPDSDRRPGTWGAGFA